MKKSYKKVYSIIFAVLIFALAVFFYLDRQAYFSHGTADVPKAFEIKEGEGVKKIGERLKEAQLVKNDTYFDYYVWKTGSREKLQAGKYELRGSMTIPEIVQVFSMGEIVSNEIKVTFPEGISAKEMAEILKDKGFSGDDFLRKIEKTDGNIQDFDFLGDKPKKAGLEGYLFPDTYIFFKNAGAENIIDKMLSNFDERVTPEMRKDMGESGKPLFDVLVMASILEKEVKTPEDMKIASGLFWKRIDQGRPLQSCATIAYVLGKEKKQYSYDDTRTPSPYNTYINTGLPPGPINNPGLNAIRAAIYPKDTEYNYFLSDPDTGKTVFSKTIEEHDANKAKYGL